MRIGSEHLSVSMVCGRMFRPDNRKEALCFSPYLYRARNLVERFFNKIKQCRRVATRYDKLAANYLAFSSRQSAYGCELMVPRPRTINMRRHWQLRRQYPFSQHSVCRQEREFLTRRLGPENGPVVLPETARAGSCVKKPT